MNGSVLLLSAIAAAAYLGRENIGDAVTQNIQVDAYHRWDQALQDAGRRYGVDWMLLKAIMWVESDLGRYRSVAQGLLEPLDTDGSVSQDKKSWGLMQITLDTAADFRPGTSAADLNDPMISIDLAAQIMARNGRHFPGNLEYQVRAYNGGLGFLKTKRGISDTPIYWAKVQTKLEKIEENGG